MAYDKVVDSAKLDADLTAIGDKIRKEIGIPDDAGVTFPFPEGMVQGVSMACENAYGNGYSKAKGEDAVANRQILADCNAEFSKKGVDPADKLENVPPKIEETYGKGATVGYEAGYTEGVAIGKQAEYADFWGKYQKNGNRVDYMRAFGGSGWNDETFKPKYSIRPNNANNMFSDSDITNLKELLNKQGVELDFSGITSDRISQVFSESTITDLGVLDVSSCTALGYFLWRALSLVNVDKVILSSNGNATFTDNTFSNLSNLVEIRFEGVIGQNGFNMRWSKKLSKASIASIVNCLSTTTSGLAITLSLDAVNKAFETSEGANDGSTSAEWEALENTKTNWTISLA